MQIVFKRRLTNELLTSYLPTMILIVIGYCTTFFKPFFFEAALTVNLTTMLVMTTIFISVMEKLPPTSYVRMIDIWLIFCIFIPFLEVCILTIKEYFTDDNLEINDHGRRRQLRQTMIFKNIEMRRNIVEVSIKIGKLLFDSFNYKINESLEQNIVPVLTLIFTLVYWTIGISVYMDVL